MLKKSIFISFLFLIHVFSAQAQERSTQYCMQNLTDNHCKPGALKDRVKSSNACHILKDSEGNELTVFSYTKQRVTRLYTVRTKVAASSKNDHCSAKLFNGLMVKNIIWNDDLAWIHIANDGASDNIAYLSSDQMINVLFDPKKTQQIDSFSQSPQNSTDEIKVIVKDSSGKPSEEVFLNQSSRIYKTISGRTVQ